MPPRAEPVSSFAIPDSVFDLARAHFAAAGRTLRNVRRDFHEWHLGRPHYALWAIDVDLPAVRRLTEQAAVLLDDVLLDDYRRQPHITLALCGFPTLQPTRPDDFGPAGLERQLDTLQRFAGAPFRMEIGGLASFTSAPFLSVRDVDGGIGRLRHALCGPRSEPGGPYTPHVTVGLYDGEWPTAPLLERLDAGTQKVVHCTVTKLSLMCYAASDIGGPLSTLGQFDLAEGRWEDLDSRIFPAPEASQTLPNFAATLKNTDQSVT
ncbi:2'-5' RNA ligase family protein [Zoogloea sp.]|uniref:2'-5' RNA ligase family protein n=1 Tax=Zoogloea sp. TaxID=49181 RepID=UPI0035B2A39A